MALDIRSLLNKDRHNEVEAEKGTKEDILRSVKRYPTDTPEEYEDVGWEDLFDPL